MNIQTYCSGATDILMLINLGYLPCSSSNSRKSTTITSVLAGVAVVYRSFHFRRKAGDQDWINEFRVGKYFGSLLNSWICMGKWVVVGLWLKKCYWITINNSMICVTGIKLIPLDVNFIWQVSGSLQVIVIRQFFSREFNEFACLRLPTIRQSFS